MADGVRDEYSRHPGGATGWYAEHGLSYRNLTTYEMLASHLRFLKKLGNEDRPEVAGF